MAGAFGNYCNWYITDGKDYLDIFESKFNAETTMNNTTFKKYGEIYSELTGAKKLR